MPLILKSFGLKYMKEQIILIKDFLGKESEKG